MTIASRPFARGALVSTAIATALLAATASADEPPPLPAPTAQPTSTPVLPASPQGTSAPPASPVPQGAPPQATPPQGPPPQGAPPQATPPQGPPPPQGTWAPQGPWAPPGAPAPMAPFAGIAPDAWKPGEPPPPGYKVSERRAWPFLPGLIVFTTSWGTSAILGAFAAAVGTNKAAAGVFIIPVVGPFIDLGWQKMIPADAVFTAVMGGLQTVGAAGLIAGLVLPKQQKLVRNSASLELTPVVTPTSQGFGLTGTF